MRKYVVLEKSVGETPLAVIQKFQNAHPEYRDIPMAYAGRLDPMASGKLLMLVGDECKKQEEYHGLDKAYEFEVLFNFGSDTGDVLGLAEWKKAALIPWCSFVVAAKSIRGPISLPYPRYSSKTVKGKPLFLWTLEGRLSEIEIPTAHSHIYQLKYLSHRDETGHEILAHILEKIELIPPVVEESKKLGADFRRDDIRARWREVLEPHKDETFRIARFSCICSSGTYIRSLAPHIASLLGTTGLAYSIHRTHIGTYTPIVGRLSFWRKKF